MVQRLIGIGHVDAGLDEPGRQVLRGLAVALQLQGPVAGFRPAVGFAVPVRAVGDGPRLQRNLVVVAEHAEGRDDVFLEVLVLVVAPDQHEIRVEIVEDLADRAEIVAEALAAAIGGAQPIIVAELGQHLFRPVGRVLARGIDVRRLQGALEHAGQPLVGQAQGRPVGDAQSKDFRHRPVPPDDAPILSDRMLR